MSNITATPLISTATVSGGAISNSSYQSLKIDGRIDSPDIREIQKRLDEIEKQLLIIKPDFEKHEKYTALKNAYDQYSLIKTLCSD